MKRLLFIIFASIAILSVFSQGFYYNVGDKKVYLTIDSGMVVSFTSPANNKNVAIPHHLTMVDSFCQNDVVLKTYNVALPKNKYNLQNREYFPQKLNLTPCYRDLKGNLKIPNGYIIVKLKNEKDIDKLKDITTKIGMTIDGSLLMDCWYSLILHPDKGLDPVMVAKQLHATGLFDIAYPTFIITNILEISYDSLVHKQWGLYNNKNPMYDISLSEAWNYATGRGIKIAIIDNGVDSTHIDLAKNMNKKSYDAEAKALYNKIYNNHATHCAGIAAGIRNNKKFITGVAPDAKIISVRINTDNANTKSISSAINWAWKNGADVISCSWGLPECDSTIKLAIDSALAHGRNGKGCVIVKSAGNKGTINFPGNHPGVITVANITNEGKIGEKSAQGEGLFIAAPGTGILSTVCGDTVAQMSGTSMAAPHVAGVAALILQRNPDLTADSVRSILAHSADKIGPYKYDTIKTYGPWNRYYGYGLVNAANAVKNTKRKE